MPGIPSHPLAGDLTVCCCRYGYERDLLALLTQLARDMDRKIERQKERAAQDNRPRVLTADDREKLDAIKVRANTLLQKRQFTLPCAMCMCMCFDATACMISWLSSASLL